MDDTTDSSITDLKNEKELLLLTDEPPLRILKRQKSKKISICNEPVTLTWENLNVFAESKKKGFRNQQQNLAQPAKHILKDVSGIISSGQLVALMGASGAGKTTLFNVLTGRNIRNLVVDGEIKVNGQEIGRDITAISAYVQQDDLFVGTMTVREHLLFQLGLTKCRNVKIGLAGVFKGISGGEAKRLAFASEVLTDPPLLFCDEPTTGLDAFMAQSVVSVLQNLANSGKTVICTIHQPASEVYAMFDRILLMADGRVAYFGMAKFALDFFEKNDYSCPKNFNPADFFVQTLAFIPGKEEECQERINVICNYYRESEYAVDIKKQIVRSRYSGSVLDLRSIRTKKSPYKANWFVQFSTLLWRSMLSNFRNRNVTIVRIAQKVVLAIFVGLIYLETMLNQEGIMNINGALFFVLTEYVFGALFGVVTILPLEYPVLLREHHNGMYKVSSYYLSKMVSYIPTYTIDGICFMTIAYFMIGLRNTAGAFFMTLLIGALLEQVSSSFGLSYNTRKLPWKRSRVPAKNDLLNFCHWQFMDNANRCMMLSAVSPNFAIALTIIGPIVTLFQMTGGLYTNVATIPVYLAWIQYISLFRYGYEALSIVQWHPVTNITCETPELACVPNGDAVLSQLSFNPDNLGMDMGLLFALYLAFSFLGYLGLMFRIYRGR